MNRSAAGLRDAMFDVLEDLRTGKITPSRARAQCDAAQRIMETVRMEYMELQIVQAALSLQRQLPRAIEHDA